MRTDDTTQYSEETATGFTVVKVAITREQSFSLQIHESKSKKTWLEAVSFRRIATVEQLQLAQTHMQSALPYPSCGYASRHNNYYTYTSLEPCQYQPNTNPSCLRPFWWWPEPTNVFWFTLVLCARSNSSRYRATLSPIFFFFSN